MKYLCLVYLVADKLHAVPDRERMNCGDDIRKKRLPITLRARCNRE